LFLPKAWDDAEVGEDSRRTFVSAVTVLGYRKMSITV
jgi:hypothetical protein